MASIGKQEPYLLPKSLSDCDWQQCIILVGLLSKT